MLFMVLYFLLLKVKKVFGTINKVFTCKFGNFQTPPSPVYAFKQ